MLLAASTRERSVGCARCTSSPTCLCCTSQRSAGVWTDARSIGVGSRETSAGDTARGSGTPHNLDMEALWLDEATHETKAGAVQAESAQVPGLQHDPCFEHDYVEAEKATPRDARMSSPPPGYAGMVQAAVADAVADMGPAGHNWLGADPGSLLGADPGARHGAYGGRGTITADEARGGACAPPSPAGERAEDPAPGFLPRNAFSMDAAADSGAQNTQGLHTASGLLPRNAFSLDAAADSDTQSTQRLAVPNSPGEPFHQATATATAVPLAHKHDTLGFAEASWMLTVDSFAGIGVRPDNIPPAQIEAFRGAIMKETSGFHPSRRRKRKGRGVEQRLDLWVFKGGPKGSARSPCKSAESLLLLSLSPLSSRMFWIVRRGRIADREMLRHRHALHGASHPAQRPPLPHRHSHDK